MKKDFDFMSQKAYRKVRGKRAELYAVYDSLCLENMKEATLYFNQYQAGLITLFELAKRFENLAEKEKAALLEAVNYKE